jgi:four helix bundle protein
VEIAAMIQTYKDLDIYKEALALFYDSHRLSMVLPKHELYEQGSQMRRAADSIISNFVEGYGRRRYKPDYVKFLVYAHASILELQCHLEKIASLYPEFSEDYMAIKTRYDVLGKKMYRFIQHVETNWNT